MHWTSHHNVPCVLYTYIYIHSTHTYTGPASLSSLSFHPQRSASFPPLLRLLLSLPPSATTTTTTPHLHHPSTPRSQRPRLLPIPSPYHNVNEHLSPGGGHVPRLLHHHPLAPVASGQERQWRLPQDARIVLDCVLYPVPRPVDTLYLAV